MSNEIIRFGKKDIGGELLPILTTGLYRDALDTLREYIQNGIDANAKHIDLKIDIDQIVITDDGTGMDKDVARKAIRLGVSDKNPSQNVGFRGIGIYSAFNLCDYVEIHTKHKRDNGCKITFDFKKIRINILKEQERRKNNSEPELYLEKLLSESVHISYSSEASIKTNGTVVILSGLSPDVYARLNSWSSVSHYLESVVPLPFRSDFKYADDIKNKFTQEDYKVIKITLTIGNRKEQLYRPYSNDLFMFKGKHDVKFFDLKHKNDKYGFAWVCINDARSVLRNMKVRGIIFKKFGFSINDRAYLENYFTQTTLYRRMTGEVIISHPNLIPNAARSDFEYNSSRQAFFEYLPNFIGKLSTWANKINSEDISREVLADSMQTLSGINNSLLKIRRDKENLLLVNNKLKDIERKLKPHRTTLLRIEPKEYKKADQYLKDCVKFVTTELTKTKSTRKTLEQQIAASINRRTVTLTKDEQKRASQQPQNIQELIDLTGISELNELLNLLIYLDTNILQPSLSKEEYTASMQLLREYLEEIS